jgi:phenylacetate-coenzyme A ligase PaaK-like adenylate-forming protein
MIKHLRAKRLRIEVDERDRLYRRATTRDERLSAQLELFNQCWSRIRLNVAFYGELARNENLPEAFRSWEEILSKFPVIDRTVIQEQHQDLIDKTRPPEWYRITGGSTAQPIQLPAWNLENAYTSPDMWLARSWYGIHPADRLFMIWGHAHLLGTGWRGRWNRHLREIKDRMLGYCRFSAYNMNSTSMRTAADAMIRFHPDYMIGYSMALDAFARSNVDRASSLQRLGLKAIIGTAEAFPAQDSVDLVGKVLGAPVAMEYGAVETNLIGHTHPEGGYRTFWRSYFVEAVENGGSGGRKVRVTSLFPRCFPLIRYEIGDEIDLPNGETGLGVTRFDRVMGRCNDYLLLADGSRIHSELVTHAVRSCSEVSGYQAIQRGTDITLLIISASDVSSALIDGIQHRLSKIHPELSKIPIVRVPALRQTIAGKTPMVIRETPPD